jgi:hypothetical protein
MPGRVALLPIGIMRTNVSRDTSQLNRQRKLTASSTSPRTVSQKCLSLDTIASRNRSGGPVFKIQTRGDMPKIGQIVHYKLTAEDAEAINRRRRHADESRVVHQHTGTIVHTGNPAETGDVYPMIITKVSAADDDKDSAINGQVFLDGDDTLWVMSALHGSDMGQWIDPRTQA